MVRMRITEKVDNHHTNINYKTLIVEFLNTDDHIRKRYTGDVMFDWCPRDKEILQLIKNLYVISPTFRQELQTMINGISAWM